MGMDPEIANEELEALLAGHGRDKNLDLTRFVDDLSAAFLATTPAAAAHLVAISEQAHLLADKGDPVARPASNAVAPVLQASRPPKRRRNTMKDKKARILLKVAAPIVAVFAVLGIMGSAGALPRALQHMTHTAGGWVGLSLPSGETEGDGTDTTDQGDQNDQGDTTSTDTSDQGDQNDQGGSTGSTDTSDQGDQNDQGGSTGTSAGSSDQGDQNDQGGSTAPTDTSDQGDQNDQGGSTGSTDTSDQGDQGSGGSSQDNQGDSSSDGGSTSSSGSGDNQN
jgi:hypothetical protein